MTEPSDTCGGRSSQCPGRSSRPNPDAWERLGTSKTTRGEPSGDGAADRTRIENTPRGRAHLRLDRGVSASAFCFVAQEVAGGESMTDRRVILALRNPANPGEPWGPPWLRGRPRRHKPRQHRRVDDHDSGRCRLPALVSRARRGPLDGDCRVRRDGAERTVEVGVRASPAGFGVSRHAQCSPQASRAATPRCPRSPI